MKKCCLILCFFLAVLFASCASRPILSQGDSIAVWDLDDLSPVAVNLPHIGELLSGEVIEATRKKGFELVERERLLLALEELQLGTTGLVDESTRLRLGRLVGARFMVFGGYQIVYETMRIDLRLVEVETGRVVRTAQKISSEPDLTGRLAVARKVTEDMLQGF